MTARFVVADVFEGIQRLADEGVTVDLVMTSPPFLALRSYLPADHPDKAKEIGSEPTPADFLDTMLDVVEACASILAPHGSICFELGDTYAGSGGAGGDYNNAGLRDGQPKFEGTAARNRALVREYDGGAADRHDFAKPGTKSRAAAGNGWPQDKSLTLIPSLFAASLAYGRNLLRPERTTEAWRVRNLVAWVRPNPPVGALGDKVRPATSYLTWATKSDKRWFDLDAVRASGPNPNTHARTAKGVQERENNTKSGDDERTGGNRSTLAIQHLSEQGAPPLDWWCISPGGYSGSHYAVYPAELCRIPIEASCPRRVCRTCGVPSRRVTTVERLGEDGHANPWDSVSKTGGPWTSGLATEHTTTGWTTCGCPGTDGIRLDGYHDGDGWRPGVVLDPFAGSGTTLMVAMGMSRDAIGIDLDERNADLARERLGMFLVVDEVVST